MCDFVCVTVCVCVLQCVAMRCSVFQCNAVCCNVLQCVVACYGVLRCIACIALYCSVMQCIAVCCSVLQCVAVCCKWPILRNCAYQGKISHNSGLTFGKFAKDSALPNVLSNHCNFFFKKLVRIFFSAVIHGKFSSALPISEFRLDCEECFSFQRNSQKLLRY